MIDDKDGITGKKMARISVLMGIYNCAATLPEALDSLYSQTYLDFKIILCDDGSTDNTYNIAKSYAEKHDNIVLIKNERNMGLNFTLNHCLEYADTEYCARMDGDDISLPTRFEKEIAFLDAHKEYAFVSCPMYYFDEDGVYGRGYISRNEPEKKDFPKGSQFCHAPCMVRREAYEHVGGYTIEKWLLRLEDAHLWMKMYMAGYKGWRLEEPLYSMRDDRNATSRRKLRFYLCASRLNYMICRNFHLPLSSYIYCLRPLLVALLPTWIYEYLHRRQFKKNCL